MRFLVDRCAGPSICKWLRVQGHDAADVRDWGDDPGDHVILERAAAERRVLVTMDKDFGALIFRLAERHTGLIRLPNVPVAQRLAILGRVLAEHGDQDLSDAVLTADAEKTRITRRSNR